MYFLRLLCAETTLHRLTSRKHGRWKGWRHKTAAISVTLGNHKPSRRWTWHSPDGTHHNEIDYILVKKKKRFRSGIKIARTRTLPGVDVGSDHDMVMMTFQTRLRKSRKPTQPRIRLDPEKLKGPTVRSAFQATIYGRFAPLARS